MASAKGLDDACEELWRSIRDKAATPKRLDLTEFAGVAPWNNKFECDLEAQKITLELQ